MPPLGLAEDVYFAVSEGQGIFLDLKRDDYVSIPIHADAANFAAMSTDAIRSCLEVYRGDLLEAGLLIDSDAPEVNLRAYQQIARPISHVLHPDDQRAFGLTGELGRAVRIRLRDWMDFWSASRAASRALKTEHIHDTVRRIRARKAKAKVTSLETVRHHTTIFRKLRPWYPRPYLCLWDALALLEFLARRNVSVDWIFGVQAQPFGAHCWLQVEAQLLNESTEYAAQFTPIMAV